MTGNSDPKIKNFQDRAVEWSAEADGLDDSVVLYRFIEASIEVARAAGATPDQCHHLVDLVWDRKTVVLKQGIGATTLSLALLAETLGQDYDMARWEELRRVRGRHILNKIDTKRGLTLHKVQPDLGV